MPLLSALARRRKLAYFLAGLPKTARILEVGAGGGWAGDYLKTNGWAHYTGLDLVPPADLVGDVRDWPALGLAAGSFDAVVAFEVVEHVDCFAACRDLLRPGGRLLLTTPLPHRDWVMKWLERAGLNQRRTSPHDHLVYLDRVPGFAARRVRVVGGLSQWGVFVK